MSNQDVANQYSALEDAFQKSQTFTMDRRRDMAEGGTVQSQEQEGVGAYVPPPQQNFTVLPTVQNPGAVYDPNATIGDISAQMATAPALPSGSQVQLG